MAINMNIGGTEKALLNMTAEMPKEKYDITIFLLEEYGGFLNEIPSWVKVKYLEKYSEIKPALNNPPLYTIKRLIKNGDFLKALSVGAAYYSSKLLKDKGIFFKYVLKNYSGIDDEYDLAVAYAGPMDFISYYVLNKVKAKKKAQWIHFDITKIGFDENFAKKYYKEFNKIFVVSEEGKDKLVKLIPSLQDKTETFFNIISCKLIEEMCKKQRCFDKEFKGKKIVTVGRLSKEKGQELIIEALAMLKKDGYNVKWYCIGDGQAMNKYRKLVKDLNLEDSFIFMGNKLNPYPYMKDCDIYVQPSLHEGYCITLGEARCFNNPIVTTNFTGANEQIKNEVNGLVCGISEDEIYKSVKRLLDDRKLYDNIKINLSSEVVDSTKEIDKLDELIYL